MRVWGLGPFDSAAALDWLDDLVDDGVTSADSYHAGTGGVDYLVVREALHAAFVTPIGDITIAYVAAGLIAARHAGIPAGAAGTRRFDADPLGLAAAGPYVTLVDDSTAAELQALAVATVDAIEVHPDWVSTWGDPGELVAVLDLLRDTLQTSDPA